jgi:hypothetical protein
MGCGGVGVRAGVRWWRCWLMQQQQGVTHHLRMTGMMRVGSRCAMDEGHPGLHTGDLPHHLNKQQGHQHQ